jgi:DNA-binding transcriptional LysR family regulator
MQHTRLIHYLNEIVRCGSIRGAAERLNVSSSAVNRQILQLERELNVALFERLPRGVRLTAAGELFHTYVRKTLNEQEHVKSLIEDLSGLRRGRIRIAAVEAVSGDFLPRAMADFLARYPKIEFDVSIAGTDEVLNLVIDDTAELGIAFNPPTRPEFKPLVKIQQPLCAVMRREHPLADRKTLRFRDCIHYPIAIAKSSLGGRSLIQDYLDRSSITIRPVLECNSFELMRVLVEHTDAIFFQIAIGVACNEKSKLLATAPIVDPALAKGLLVLGARRYRSLPVATSLFAEQLRSAMQQE